MLYSSGDRQVLVLSAKWRNSWFFEGNLRLHPLHVTSDVGFFELLVTIIHCCGDGSIDGCDGCLVLIEVVVVFYLYYREFTQITYNAD
jgi:hypothetical protein